MKWITILSLIFMVACDVDQGSIAVIGTGDATLDMTLAVQDAIEKTKEAREENPEDKREEVVLRILEQMEALIGTEYVYGKTDCSWLIRESFNRAGFPLKHLSSRGMYEDWLKTDTPNVGDIFYFTGHVGASLVDTSEIPKELWEMLHNGSSTGVEKRLLSSQGGYWLRRYLCGLIPPPLTPFINEE